MIKALQAGTAHNRQEMTLPASGELQNPGTMRKWFSLNCHYPQNTTGLAERSGIDDASESCLNWVTHLAGEISSYQEASMPDRQTTTEERSAGRHDSPNRALSGVLFVGGDQVEHRQRDTITPRWLRPRQWQQLTGMGRTHTYELIKAGELRAVTIGRAVFIDAREVEAFFERARTAA